ncbi:MAG: hypothetical protein MRY72_08840 [Aquisalinus sp.]|nr:hypothetical protein [Aquisalinus sp.]
MTFVGEEIDRWIAWKEPGCGLGVTQVTVTPGAAGRLCGRRLRVEFWMDERRLVARHALLRRKLEDFRRPYEEEP